MTNAESAALTVAIVSAFFAAVSWWATLRSARAAEKALALQAQALDSQIEDTKAALAISERLAQANEALAISGQRGWVVVADAKVTISGVKSYVFDFLVTFTNVGKTPVSTAVITYCRAFTTTKPVKPLPHPPSCG